MEEEQEASEFTVRLEFLGTISPSVQDTVRAELDQLLPLMERSALQTGDAVISSRHTFRIASRTWYLNRFERCLVIRLKTE